MLKNSTNYINLLLLALVSYIAFLGLKPNNVQVHDAIQGNFKIQNAYNHVQAMAKAPHFVGSDAHAEVKDYVVEQLEQLGLSVEIQSSNAVSSRSTFSHVENIIAKIAGSNPQDKALLLMSHYDSAQSASFGAADAGSGVATLLEGIRAYIEQGETPKNDIIILITDGEELGLIGAQAFVAQHPWANDVEAVLNFEARGSAGPSYMLMETNGGNSKLLDAYIQANTPYTVSDSLSYSIYKSLPNDTDLTVFRRDKNIPGFNFAFIDDHFNYHTALDTAQNLSLDSLAHQGHYLMPMLRTLSQMDLEALQSEQDDVFFQIPYWTTIKYPFAWTMPLSILVLLLFSVTVWVGIKKGSLKLKSIGIGIIPLLLASISTVALSYGMLSLLYWLHPQYGAILQGFTYNGHGYMVFFALLAISLGYFCYRPWFVKHTASNLMVMPTLLWILVSLAAAIWLIGGHFFVLIALAGTLILLLKVISGKPKLILTTMLCAVMILIFFPFVLLPVALGMQLLPYSGVLIVLFLAVFISCLHLPNKTPINGGVFLLPLLCALVYAQLGASISQDRPLPNSLYYFQDQDNNSAYWLNDDEHLDEWNGDYFAKDNLSGDALSHFYQQNWAGAQNVSKTANRHVPAATIAIIKDQTDGEKRHLQMQITPQRIVNRLRIENNQKVQLSEILVNDQIIYKGPNITVSGNRKMFGIVRTSEEVFTLDFVIEAGEVLDIKILEFSFDLLTSNHFDMPARPKHMMAKAFINSDSIITKQNIRL